MVEDARIGGLGIKVPGLGAQGASWRMQVHVSCLQLPTTALMDLLMTGGAEVGKPTWWGCTQKDERIQKMEPLNNLLRSPI